MAPFAVWNWAPAASTTECRCPFGSLRVTRSPACRWPVRTPDSGWSAGSCDGSTILDAEEAELPSRPEGTGVHGDAAADELLFVALAERQHRQVERGLPLERGQQILRGL